uniref:FBD domain-containing protein n=1 Tax=Arundo donax TaxID=35708 RepID=A0A0A9HMI5_ARUDO
MGDSPPYRRPRLAAAGRGLHLGALPRLAPPVGVAPLGGPHPQHRHLRLRRRRVPPPPRRHARPRLPPPRAGPLLDSLGLLPRLASVPLPPRRPGPGPRLPDPERHLPSALLPLLLPRAYTPQPHQLPHPTGTRGARRVPEPQDAAPREGRLRCPGARGEGVRGPDRCVAGARGGGARLRNARLGRPRRGVDDSGAQSPEAFVAQCLWFGGRMEDFPRLEEAILFGPNFAKFLTGMVGITKLDFSCIPIWPTEVHILEKLPFLFENLRRLSVAVNFCKMSHILCMFCLLRSAPDLEELDVWGWSNGTQKIKTNNEFLKIQRADHVFAKLHVVRMKKFTFLTNEMHFMEFVLSKARILQVLYVTLASYTSYSNEEVVTEIAE